MVMRAQAPDPDPRAVRDMLRAGQVSEFEAEYRQAMTTAAENLDLNPVLELLERWRRIAWIAQDPAAEQRMQAAASRLEAGEDIPTEPWDVTRRRLGL